MKHTITHACGHEEIHQLYGPNRERTQKLEWLPTTLCTECFKAQKLDEAKNATAGYPALIGTPKQVAYATNLRAEKVKRIEEKAVAAREVLARISELPVDKVAAYLEKAGEHIALLERAKIETSAVWWIEL